MPCIDFHRHGSKINHHGIYSMAMVEKINSMEIEIFAMANMGMYFRNFRYYFLQWSLAYPFCRSG